MMMIRVSIVDPNRQMRESMAAAVAQQASGVLCLHKHADAGEAMPYLATALPDILLVDIDRPGRGGIESVVSFKTAHPPLIVLVLTSRDDNHEVLEALRKSAV